MRNLTIFLLATSLFRGGALTSVVTHHIVFLGVSISFLLRERHGSVRGRWRWGCGDGDTRNHLAHLFHLVSIELIKVVPNVFRSFMVTMSTTSLPSPVVPILLLGG